MFSMGGMPSTHDLSTALLRVFAEAARHGSFTATARALDYTQSAVSRQVAALEEEAGTALFDRLPRGIRLTEPGHRLLAHAHVVLERLDEARRELSDLRELATGRLRIGAFATADAALVPHAIAAFRASYPDITVTLEEGYTTELLAMLTAGEADVAVLSADEDQLLEGVDLRKLCDDFLYIALPPGHRLANRRQVRLADLANEEWIAGSSRPEDTLIRSCLRTGFRPRIGFVAKDWIAKQGCVAAGLGITLIPSLAADAVRSDITLVALDPQDIAPRQVFAATRRGLAPTPAVQAFLAQLGTRSPTRSQ